MEQRNGRPARAGNIVAKEYANNTVECFIYAVQRSLDSYRFNTLQNKSVFIHQMKSCNLATRTLDEGGIDESSGSNYSEYVAMLSGNDDLLEKAKLEKKQVVLESEKQAFQRSKGNARGKLKEFTEEIEKNNTFIERFTKDWEYLNRKAPKDNETGLRPNPLKLDGVAINDIEILGNKLSVINEKARTENDHMKIGMLFDFRILVRTEKQWDGGLEFLQNKFMIEGLDGLKYTYNNGNIAKDPKLAVANFINALERIPDMIAKRQEKNAEMEKNLPVLQEIVSATWTKEEELRRLNEDILALNRQIQLTIQPKKQEENTNDNELVIGSNEVAARHVSSLKVIVPHTELKKIS